MRLYAGVSSLIDGITELAIDKVAANYFSRPRCEIFRYPEADLTQQRGEECGTPTEYECSECGPICLHCSIETHCVDLGLHRLVKVSDSKQVGQAGGVRRVDSASAPAKFYWWTLAMGAVLGAIFVYVVMR